VGRRGLGAVLLLAEPEAVSRNPGKNPRVMNGTASGCLRKVPDPCICLIRREPVEESGHTGKVQVLETNLRYLAVGGIPENG